MLGTQKLGSARNGVLSVQLGVAFRPTGMRANRTATHAAAPVELSPESIDVTAEAATEDKPFPYHLPMDSAQQSLSNIPLAMFYPALLAFVGGSGLLGSMFGRALPVEPETKEVASYGTAALVGAGAVFASIQAKKKRASASVVDLYNTIVDLPDPSHLTPNDVAAVGSKYGISMQKDEIEGLQKIYGQFLEAVIPSGETQLKGDEADRVRMLKDALGLSDEDAAPAHIDVARRLYRQGFETKDRQQQFEQRKAFQRLVYVSQLIFGDQKAAFLLPWRQHFTLTEAQLFVARRDNAKAIFKAKFEAQGGELKADRHFLRELRDRQLAVKMMDESAVEVVKDYTRRHAEVRITNALDAIKATGESKREEEAGGGMWNLCDGKNKDLRGLVGEVEYVLDYSRKLAKYANEEDLMPGLGHVNLSGGALAQEGKARELKDLYKIFLEEKMERLGEFSAALDQDAKDLQVILGLTTRDAQVMRDEVAAKLYKRLLREEVVSRRIDEAASPAAVLQSLCEKVRFGPEAALELHKQLYRTKMVSLVEKGKLTETDQEDLKRIRRILCIPADVANKVARDTSGKVLESVLGEVLLAGAKPLPEMELDRVDKVVSDLKIETNVAMEVLSAASRDRFKAYVMQSQKDKGDRRESAASLKKLIQFNSLVVTPLVERLSGREAAMKEMAELLAKAKEEAEKEGATEEEIAAKVEKVRESTVKEVQKAIQANRGEFGDDERKGQKDINLKNDVDVKIRAEVYKGYLMYTMSGDVVELPVGGVVRKKNNANSRQTEMARLSQLGDLLGMDQAEIMASQSDLAEQAYKAQATDVMRSGPMTQEKSAYLEELRGQLGLQKEAADKVIKAARSEVYGTSASFAEEGGRWTIERIKDVTSKGGSIDGLVEEITRKNIFRRELERAVTDGTGDLDSDYILNQLPSMLSLEEKKVKPIIKEIVASRRRMLLVQAVSQYRQKRPAETVVSLQNLLSCSRALPEKDAIQWSERAELRDIFQAFCTQESNGSKRSAVQAVLGLTDAEAAEIQCASDSDEGKAAAAEASRDADDSFF